MSFLRPHALSLILRWRETLIGLGAAGLGAWWTWDATGILRWVGVAFVLGGLAIAREGWSRAQRPLTGEGPGVVDVTERQVTYLSGHGGGAISIEHLLRVEIDARRESPYRSEVFWIFTPENGDALRIPGDARGAERIFDALAALPGVDQQTAIRVAGGGMTGRFTLWRKPGSDRPRLLH